MTRRGRFGLGLSEGCAVSGLASHRKWLKIADEGNPWSVRAENRTCTHESSLVAASEVHNKGEFE
jgi:hypothetical protein